MALPPFLEEVLTRGLSETLDARQQEQDNGSTETPTPEKTQPAPNKEQTEPSVLGQLQSTIVDYQGPLLLGSVALLVVAVMMRGD